jgi:hypothetical protein
VDWRVSNIAVQIHPGIEHQAWWADEPFVANNNFHVFTTTDTVAVEDREIVAASIASAFGALESLYMSSEVGCEGVRWSDVHLGVVCVCFRTYGKRKQTHKISRRVRQIGQV